MRFIHVSDLHYHRNAADNRDADSLLKYINSHYKDNILIATGDITDDGHPVQFEKAFEALEPFKGRVFICPGNHDFGAVGLFYHPEKARLFDERLSIPLEQGGTFAGANQPVINILGGGDERLMLIGLDTNLETDHPFDFACGEVGDGQLAALDAVLANPTTAPFKKILYFHHHPFMHNNPFMEMKDAEKLARVIFGKVDVALFGHRHVWGDWKNVHMVKHHLASDKSPGKDWVREIVYEGGELTVNPVPAKSGVEKKKTGGRTNKK